MSLASLGVEKCLPQIADLKKTDQDERAFFYDGMPSMIDYTVRKYSVEEAGVDPEKFLLSVWGEKEKELVEFYENGKTIEKYYSHEISTKIQLISKASIIFWPWFIVHTFMHISWYLLILVPSFIIILILMKKYGDMAKFCLPNMQKT